MHYTDVLYPFPVNPPHVPDENPTGIYKKTVVLDEQWMEKDTVLKFHGVDSAFDVWVNGNHVGFGKVSRLPSEFDITGFVKTGENDITVRVYKWSDGTYLEDQDMWWLSGIYRDVELINEEKNAVLDVQIDGSLDDSYTNGLFTSKIKMKQAGTNIKWKLSYKGEAVFEGEASFKDREIYISADIPSVHTWTAETPELYDFTISTDTQEVTVRCGFRRIEIKDKNFCVNGQVILLNGVNHHDYNPKEGRTVTREQMEDDIRLMKQYNINAVRCSHYPANEYFYDLCDEYCLYVINEADLECHGFEWVENYTWITDDESWKNVYVDRSVRMVKRDRNHPSIIMWSMGNESAFGCNFRSAAQAIRELDDTRLIHYEGDFEAEVTDVYSTMYTRLKGLKEIAEYEVKGDKPHVMCEYGHAMGNGPGGLKAYQDMYRKYKRLQGGFLWEWYDHGIYTEEKDKKYYKYAPEFTIEHTYEPDDDRKGYEYYLFAQTDSRPHWCEIRICYHQTVLAELGGVILDGGRYFTATPDRDGISLTEYHNWDVPYRYMVKENLNHLVHEFYYVDDGDEARHSHNEYEGCILIFEDEKEHQRFKIYVRKNWDRKDEFVNDIWIPHMEQLPGYNVDAFREEYLNVQILRRMLQEFRNNGNTKN
mgnify:CR=1 FL=1